MVPELLQDREQRVLQFRTVKRMQQQRKYDE